MTGPTRRAKLQVNRYHEQTNTMLYRPDALPVAQPTVSQHWKKLKEVKPWIGFITASQWRRQNFVSGDTGLASYKNRK